MRLNITVSIRPISNVGNFRLMDDDAYGARVTSAVCQHDETLMTGSRPGEILNLGP
jgi:hypothetical protein